MTDGDAFAGQRLFVAIALAGDTRAALAVAADMLAAAGVRARRVPCENYHATVAFLGAVSGERLDPIAARLRDAAAHCGAFALPVDRIGGFPNDARARVVWAGTSTPSPLFAALCAGVRARLTPLGFAFAQDAAFHVTLFRAKQPQRIPAVAPPPAVCMSVDALTLFASHGGARGVRYVALETFALAQLR
ncbi:MAG: RNA 2',3'-cyclic phosphodiesterase [Candidatus Velthaea sp.]